MSQNAAQDHVMKSLILLIGTCVLGCSSLNKSYESLSGASARQLVLERRMVRDTEISDFLGYRRTNRMSPLLTDRYVIQGNAVDSLTVYDRKSGRMVWKLKVENGVEGGVELAGDVLYFGAGDGFLRAAKLSDGEILWTTPTRAELLAPPTLENNMLFVQTGADVVYGLEASSGKLVWSYNRQVTGNLSVRASSRPVVVGDKILIGFSDGFLVSLRKRDGALQWERKLGKGNRFRDIDSTPVVANGVAYVSSFDGTLAAVKAETGEIIWQSDFGGYLPVTLGTGAFSDRLFFSTVDGRIVEVDKDTGKEKRSVKLKTGIATQAVQIQGLLVFGESEGSLRVVDLENLKNVAQYQSGAGILSTPTFDKQSNELWFISNNAYLYSMKLSFRKVAERFPWKMPSETPESESF